MSSELAKLSSQEVGSTYEVLKRTQEGFSQVVDYTHWLVGMPGSDKILFCGRNLHFYDPLKNTTTFHEIPRVLSDDDKTVGTSASPDGNVVVAHTDYGPAHVFDGHTGEKLPYTIPPNEVGPRALKRFEAESKSLEELETKKQSYCGIRGVEFSPRGRYGVVKFKNHTSRVFDFKEREYTGPVVNTYSQSLGFGEKGELLLRDMAEDKEFQEVELDYPVDEPIGGRSTIRCFPVSVSGVSGDTSSRISYRVIDGKKGSSTTLEIGSAKVLHDRFVIGYQAIGRKGVTLIYDTETGRKIDLTKVPIYVEDVMLSDDGKYGFFKTTLSGLEPLNLSKKFAGFADEGFRLEVWDLETMSLVPTPLISIDNNPVSFTLFPIPSTHDVLVVNGDGRGRRIKGDLFATDPEVGELVVTHQDMLGEMLGIAEALEHRHFIPEEMDEKEQWAKFLVGRLELTPSMRQKAASLESIQLRDGGNALSNLPEISLMQLAHSGELHFKQLAAEVYLNCGNVPYLTKDEIQNLFGQARRADVYGRTIHITTNGRSTALKLQRENESLEALYNEGSKMILLNALKPELGLQSDLPIARFNHGQFLRRLRGEYLPDSVRGQLPENIAGTKTWVGMVFDAPEDYFTYYRELSDNQADQATSRVMNDLFRLARVGYIHPDLIELFHNRIQSGRPDAGRYIWNIDLVRPMRTRAGSGRLHAWERAVDFPNFGASGLRDFAELKHFYEIYSYELDRPHAAHLRNNLLRLPWEMREKVALQYFLGNYMLAWVLAEGRRLHDAEELLESDDLHPLAGRIQQAYQTAYASFTGGDLEEPFAGSEVIDYQRFAQQMEYFMIAPRKSRAIVPKEIFGFSVRSFPGDGYGYIDQDLLGEELEKAGIKNTAAFIKKYFIHPQSSRRQVPDSIVILSGEVQDHMVDFEYSGKKGSRTDQILYYIFSKYGRSMRANGRDEDLGPMNGPLPLTEMIKANYLMTSSAIAHVS